LEEKTSGPRQAVPNAVILQQVVKQLKTDVPSLIQERRVDRKFGLQHGVGAVIFVFDKHNASSW